MNQQLIRAIEECRSRGLIFDVFFGSGKPMRGVTDVLNLYNFARRPSVTLVGHRDGVNKALIYFDQGSVLVFNATWL